jgi:hypothetical protein
MGLDTKTYLLTDRQSQCDFDFDRNILELEKNYLKSKAVSQVSTDKQLRGEIQPECGRLSKKWSDAEPEDKSLVYVL